MKRVEIILASQSPRRAELLRQVGIPFTQLAANIDESLLQYESVTDYALRMSIEKGEAVWEKYSDQLKPGQIILGADTVLSYQEYIIGKPRNYADFRQILESLSDDKHYVYSAIALLQLQQDGTLKQIVRLNTNSVTFSEIPHSFIEYYWSTGEPQDKAGGYAIQGLMANYIARISGSYSGIMGLPLFELREALDELGYQQAWKR